MRQGGVEINVDEKRKVEVPRKKRTNTVADNLLEDPDQALDLAVSKGSTASREESIPQKIPKGLGKGLGVKPNIQDYKDDDSDDFDNITWTSDEKTYDDDSHIGDDQTGMYGIHFYGNEEKQPTLKSHSPSITCSSQEDVTRYLNEQPGFELTDIMCKPVQTDIQKTFVVPILEGNPEVTSYISCASEVPLGTNVDVEAPCILLKKLAKHEQRLDVLSKINVLEYIEELNEVNNKLPKIMPDVVSAIIQPRLDRTVLQALKSNQISLITTPSISSTTFTEYESKLKLYNIMFKRKSFNTHEHHHTLYNALMNSMSINEIQARGEPTQPSHKKHSHDDYDPLENHKGENTKRRRKNIGGSSSKKGKAHQESSIYETFVDADEPQQEQKVPAKIIGGKYAQWFKQQNNKVLFDDEAHEQSWFNDFVDANKYPKEF
ncbi:hypothetical protein Tco_0689218 [Tanacetum coccineum]